RVERSRPVSSSWATAATAAERGLGQTCRFSSARVPGCLYREAVALHSPGSRQHPGAKAGRVVVAPTPKGLHKDPPLCNPFGVVRGFLYALFPGVRWRDPGLWSATASR